MATIHDPSLIDLIPSELPGIPDHDTTKDDWVIGIGAQGNNTFFDTQWVQCSYQISGGYGHTPRYIYYFLILFAMWKRRTDWLAEAAMASVMVYSGSAAIHAVVLAATRGKMAPRSMLQNYGTVRVEGATTTGTAPTWDSNQDEWISDGPFDNSLWLPVLPMAWDSDVDATLAIVGTAFLVLLPMQTWSRALRRSRVKIVVWLWGTLLLTGMVCALVAEQYIQAWYFGQLRFCPTGAHDSLPLMNDGRQTVGGEWDGYDGYDWNRTIKRQFIDKTSTEALSNVCIYPCFDFDWPLRDNTEILAVERNYNIIFVSDTFFVLLIICYSLVTSTGLSSLTIAVLTSLPRRWTLRGLRPHSDQDALKLRLIPQQLRWIRDAWKNYHLGWIDRTAKIALSTYFLIVYVYTFFVSPVVVFFFVGFMEWTIWGSDPGGETFYHVGQWSTNVALALVFIAAAISHYSKSPSPTATP
ncbi:hypothetical protein INS49_002971 [Diaporthe citri]|uniref:uncharacterized protein n=1 Tax=Diaporthe citri TaxID=83186 RepID=UPI001C7ED710|nr:uncharacterized protein INS49_002971 [Diaporthe citri]KAG6368757.1 hypothetical protein INS49_002971 [Diaporthe citri]